MRVRATSGRTPSSHAPRSPAGRASDQMATEREDAEIPMRPDHGHDILTDIGAGAQPGYPAVGRLKGLAELRGVMAALTRNAA